jgi:hypothetical protein
MTQQRAEMQQKKQKNMAAMPLSISILADFMAGVNKKKRHHSDALGRIWIFQWRPYII